VTQAPNEPNSQRGAGQTAAPQVRRRVSSEPSEQNKGRGGCLLTGAILGIIVGATFAFYGLPPILKHFYGEQHIAIGQTYTGDAKVVSVQDIAPRDVQPNSGQQTIRATVVRITVTTNKTWEPKPSDFSLEYEHGTDWVPAIALNFASLSGPDSSSPPVLFGQRQLGNETHIDVAFPVADSSRGAPEYLHLADPRVRFALPTAQAASAK
jgi:hypothetical protein